MQALHDVQLVTAKPEAFTLTAARCRLGWWQAGAPSADRVRGLGAMCCPLLFAQLQAPADYGERERQRMTEFMREHSTRSQVPSAVPMPPCTTGAVSHLISTPNNTYRSGAM